MKKYVMGALGLALLSVSAAPIHAQSLLERGIKALGAAVKNEVARNPPNAPPPKASGVLQGAGYKEFGSWLVEDSSTASTEFFPARHVEFGGSFSIHCYSTNGSGASGVRYEVSLSTVEMPEAQELLKRGRQYELSALIVSKGVREAFLLPSEFSIAEGPEGSDPVFNIDLSGPASGISVENAAFLRAIAQASEMKLVFQNSRNSYTFDVETRGSAAAVSSLYCADGIVR